MSRIVTAALASQILKLAEELEKEANLVSDFVCDSCGHTNKLASINSAISEATSIPVEKLGSYKVLATDTVKCPKCEKGKMSFVMSSESAPFYENKEIEDETPTKEGSSDTKDPFEKDAFTNPKEIMKKVVGLGPKFYEQVVKEIPNALHAAQLAIDSERRDKHQGVDPETFDPNSPVYTFQNELKEGEKILNMAKMASMNELEKAAALAGKAAAVAALLVALLGSHGYAEGTDQAHQAIKSMTAQKMLAQLDQTLQTLDNQMQPDELKVYIETTRDAEGNPVHTQVSPSGERTNVGPDLSSAQNTSGPSINQEKLASYLA